MRSHAGAWEREKLTPRIHLMAVTLARGKSPSQSTFFSKLALTIKMANQEILIQNKKSDFYIHIIYKYSAD
ncbi:hypothetical protein QUF54_05225 [Candidatus Marithioploca araucensis]|uniref:Uncharacterized protein n=1 Tax=Candidatus Marithioploca araucensis TaxID=70273 RepID=A0ABT7VT44_9GAMM|nr:hypothetical protein [Candidatus Marithioploca araucensis]